MRATHSAAPVSSAGAWLHSSPWHLPRPFLPATLGNCGPAPRRDMTRRPAICTTWAEGAPCDSSRKTSTSTGKRADDVEKEHAEPSHAIWAVDKDGPRRQTAQPAQRKQRWSSTYIHMIRHWFIRYGDSVWLWTGFCSRGSSEDCFLGLVASSWLKFQTIDFPHKCMD